MAGTHWFSELSHTHTHTDTLKICQHTPVVCVWVCVCVADWQSICTLTTITDFRHFKGFYKLPFAHPVKPRSLLPSPPFTLPCAAPVPIQKCAHGCWCSMLLLLLLLLLRLWQFVLAFYFASFHTCVLALVAFARHCILLPFVGPFFVVDCACRVQL